MDDKIFSTCMEEIEEYAKKHKMSIADACKLHETEAKLCFYGYLKNKLDYNGIPVELYTKDQYPIGVAIAERIDINIPETVNLSSDTEVSGTIETK